MSCYAEMSNRDAERRAQERRDARERDEKLTALVRLADALRCAQCAHDDKAVSDAASAYDVARVGFALNG